MTTLTKVKYRYEIEQSEYTESPRDWDNLGTMALFHDDRHYTLPNESVLEDTHPLNVRWCPWGYPIGFDDWDEVEKELVQRHEVYPSCILPVHIYGNKIDTEALKGGQVGFIFMDKYTIKENALTKPQAIRILKREVETYSCYLQGDVWDVRVYDDCDNLIDTCYEVYGYEHCDEIGLSMIKDIES